MKIGIDISAIIYGTGVSVYTKNLLESLLEIDKTNDYVLFGGSMRRMDELKSYIKSIKKDNVQGRVLPIAPTLADLIWNKLHVIPIDKLIGRLDVFHSSDWTQPPTASFKVTTIHDLSPILFPEYTHSKIINSHLGRIKWVKSEVDRVIVPSVTTGEDAVKLGISKVKIRVIPEAIEPGMKKSTPEQVKILKNKYRITGDYILAVGVNRRKNTENIIKAYEKIRSGSDLKLVVIGHKHVDFPGGRGVIFLGHVPNSDLATFYSGAKALVYPSFYEGFGIPIIYAFACESPVVTSDLGSMKEISAGAAVLVDPNDTNSIAEGIKKAVKDKGELIRKGLLEAKKYSWIKTAQETLKIYEESK